MKRKRCRTCKHTMRGHKRRFCSKEERLILEDGASVYVGSVYQNKPSGYGFLDSKDCQYKGQFLSGKKHGYGVQTHADGTEYIGEWANDTYHGKGSLTLSDATIYEGLFENGLLNGYGCIKSATSEYYGILLNGQYHGKGTLKTNEGAYYGDFLHGVKHGKGVFKWTNGDLFSGFWRRGMRCGKGTLTTQEGMYVGQWLHDLRHGRGRFSSQYTGVYEGFWKDNQRHNQGKQTYKDGTIYEGGWSKGKKTGYGTQTWPDGDVYKGFWLKDEYNGRGTLRLGNCTYTGEWVAGQRVGLFKECNDDNTTLSGTWVNDVRHGVFENQDGKKFMYIWGTLQHFDYLFKAKQSLRQSLAKKEYDTAQIIGEYYPNILSWTLISTYDTDGLLLKQLPQKRIHEWTKKHMWFLFRQGRYTFMETLVSLCDTDIVDRLCTHVPQLFDHLTHDFVANPWMVHHISYSSKTKQRLLEGLHLGELGRCPPKDPFTRNILTESSGTYLNKKNTRFARDLYKLFMDTFDVQPTIREMAYSFDLDDFEESIRNARDAKDIQTLRKLLQQRDAFIQQRRLV